MQLDCSSYTVEELCRAFEFYLKGPKENAQVRAMLKHMARYLANDAPDDPKWTAQVDNLLDTFYQEWSE